MKHILLVVIFVAITGNIVFADDVVITGEQVAENESVQLDIELSCSNTRISINDEAAFDVKLINKGKEKLTVSAVLQWSYYTLMMIVRDETGKLMSSSDVFFYFPPPPHDTSVYISLFPNHYFGATLFEPAVNLFEKPGKYYVSVAYISLISENHTEERFGIKNLWGRERNPITSNVIGPIEITK